MTRWPGWVYETGDEPDFRFSFANERTFLAWIRTALALIAAGVALDFVDFGLPGPLQHLVASLLVILGLIAAVLAWIRWAAAERAMRRGEALPSFGVGIVVTIGIVLVGSAAVLALWWR